LGSQRFDAIVVGGRVAGASCAINMAKRGLRVLLLEQWDILPPIVSTHVLYPFGVELLHRLGLKGKLEESDFVKSRKTRIDLLGDGGKKIDVQRLNDVDYMLCPTRDWLDNELLELASSYPSITIMRNMRVKGLTKDDNRVTGVFGVYDNQTVSFHSNLVVGADGRNSVVAKCVGAKTLHQQKMQHSVYYGYYSGFQQSDGPMTEFVYEGSEIHYAFPVTQRLTCLTINLSSKNDFNSNASLGDRITDKFKNANLGLSTGGIRLDGRVMGIKHNNHYLYVRQCAGKGWALVGDAAIHTNPTFGQGIGMALRMSESLAQIAALGITRTGNSSAVLAKYSRWRDRTFWDLYLLSALITNAGGSPKGFSRYYRNEVNRSAELAEITFSVMNETVSPLTYLKELFKTSILKLPYTKSPTDRLARTPI